MRPAGNYDAERILLKLADGRRSVSDIADLLARNHVQVNPTHVRQFFADLFTNPAYQPLDLTPDQIYLADEMRFNRDPFDALICAAARSVDLPLITRDGEIRGSGAVKVLW